MNNNLQSQPGPHPTVSKPRAAKGAPKGSRAGTRRRSSDFSILTIGFRPLFLGAGIWAVLAMALWLMFFRGQVDLPTAFDPVSWHAHEMLFGYLAAVAAGFLLTAVPNWTGRLPVAGGSLAGLAALWLVGRVTVAVSAHLDPVTAAVLDLSFLSVLAAVIAREIISGRNWRNLPVLIILATLIAGNAVFHWEAATGEYAAEGLGFRIGLAAAVMLIVVIGGRIIPSFTRNWLVKRGEAARPAPFGWFDRLTIALTGAGLLAWLTLPHMPELGVVLLAVGIVQLLRLCRWCGHRTGAEALVWILHAGYTFVPIGFLAIGVAMVWPDYLDPIAAQHLWMAGAIGVMTLAVMTRATLGHSGRELTAGAGTTAIYMAAIAGAIVRLLPSFWPEYSMIFYDVSGLLWCLAFIGFVLLYWGALVRRPKKT